MSALLWLVTNCGDLRTTQTGISEDVTEEELVENNAFLNAVVETAPMRYVHAYATRAILLSLSPEPPLTRC